MSSVHITSDQAAATARGEEPVPLPGDGPCSPVEGGAGLRHRCPGGPEGGALAALSPEGRGVRCGESAFGVRVSVACGGPLTVTRGNGDRESTQLCPALVSQVTS